MKLAAIATALTALYIQVSFGAPMDEPMRDASSMVTLKASDGQSFHVEKNIAMVSNTIKVILEDGEMNVDEDSFIPLANIDSKVWNSVSYPR